MERRAIGRFPVAPTDTRGGDVGLVGIAGEAEFATTIVWPANEVRLLPAEPLSAELFTAWLLT
jgi:hypothetical protein